MRLDQMVQNLGCSEVTFALWAFHTKFRVHIMGARVLAAAISKGHIGLFLTFRPTFRPRQLDPPKRSQGDRNRHFLRCPG